MHQRSCLFDQGLGWNPQPPVQVPGHGHGKRALVIEHFVNTVGAADLRDEIFDREIALLHHELDGFDRVGEIEREMSCLIRLNQGY